ncbi:MAG: SIMPL domain-containing protein [Pseudomonadota bacterium]|tara:strand:- start:208 stop:966 length:759 start_codon:yes stop_codon:yes gene_type:complete
MGVRGFVGAVLLGIAPFAMGAANAQTTNAAKPGTVELRLNATGQSVKRADFVTIYVPISTNAETASAARSANSAAITTLTNALVERGIDRGSITLMPAATRFGFIGNEAYDPSDTPQVPQGMAAMMARKTAYSTIRVRLTDASLVDRVREVLDQQNQSMTGAPTYALNDDRSAKNEAIADAIAKVRQDAEAYAAPLGLRVERITSVSSYGDATSTMPDVNFFAQMMAGTQEGPSNSVTTRAQVWVNFALVPR